LKYDLDLPSRDFCILLLNEAGVMLTPGSAMDKEGWIRIGYANDPEILSQDLHKISEFLASKTKVGGIDCSVPGTSVKRATALLWLQVPGSVTGRPRHNRNKTLNSIQNTRRYQHKCM
jgi:hypothetical protein